MNDHKTLPPASVKDRQISGQAKISHGKLAQVGDAQILLGGSDKKLSAKTVSGDATLANDGTLTLNDASIETRIKSVLTSLDIESGAGKNMTAGEVRKIYEEIPGVNQFNNSYAQDLKNAGAANSGSTLVKRDKSGDIAVGTVTGDLTGTSTNSTKLNNQTETYYTNVDNHVNGSTTTLGIVGTGLAGSTNKTNVKKIVYEAIAGGGSHYYYTIPHNFGYYPHVTVMHGTPVDPNASPVVYNYEEIDAEVENGTTSTTVRTSEQGLILKMILS